MFFLAWRCINFVLGLQLLLFIKNWEHELPSSLGTTMLLSCFAVFIFQIIAHEYGLRAVRHECKLLFFRTTQHDLYQFVYFLLDENNIYCSIYITAPNLLIPWITTSSSQKLAIQPDFNDNFHILDALFNCKSIQSSPHWTIHLYTVQGFSSNLQ